MVREPFLINPPRRIKRTRSNRAGLPKRLMSTYIKRYGRSEGLKRAWKVYKKGRKTGNPQTRTNSEEVIIVGANPRKKTKKGIKHRPVLYEVSKKAWSRGPKSRSKIKGITINPFSEEVIVVGANPRKNSKNRVVRKNRAVSNPWQGQSRKHSAAAKKGWRKRRRKNPVMTLSNAKNKKRRYSRRRENPALRLPLIGDVGALLVPTLIGAGSIVVTKKVPDLLNLTGTLQRVGSQVGSALIGNIIIRKTTRSVALARIWTIAALATLVADYAITKFLPLSGVSIGAFPGFSYAENVPAIESAEAYGAFPEDMGNATYGAFPEDVSVTPYD